MKYVCNPVNFGYKYQFNKQQDGRVTASREAADPSMIEFKGRYYIYPSMTCGFLYSDDMAEWKFQPVKNLPVYDYAPDVRVMGDYIYFCASNHEKGTHYRTTDPFSDTYEKIDGAFPFWDPNMFVDEDDKVYFFWGSSTTEPLYGIELDRETLQPIGERQNLVYVDESLKGYERTGENHIPERTPEEKAAIMAHMKNSGMPESMIKAAEDFILGRPYVEGVWVNKHNGRYYLQYGASGSRFNVYGDGVYISDKPLGPYTLAKNNPYSYKPGGFLPGAGHGSTMEDVHGNVWHVATMRICKNHNFERRIGIWPAGWDEDGELFCNQRFGDWPYVVEEKKMNPWKTPEWMLLSYKRKVSASSYEEGYGPENAVDENVQTWWKATSNEGEQWLLMDLGQSYDVRAIQINFADDNLAPELPENAVLQGALQQQRWIDEVAQYTRWKLEGSLDGEEFFVIEDKSQADTDLPHDLVVREDGINVRYLKLTVVELPYEQTPCVSGLRVFGKGDGNLPTKAENVKVKKDGDLDIHVSWNGDAVGYNVLWGYEPSKLYHCYQIFDENVHIGGVVRGQEIYIRVDSFNESGITEGDVFLVE